ncbi:MAG: UvrD-helicase domain-containing protein, partial [Lachnospiraceae bacterium]|nr:UvrD-helicase domain-containing protein [Lachnospiraceae bacterium]
MSILEGLNSEQAQAVLTTDGPLLVLAGAGSGKTTVLTRRIAHIIEQKKARPWQILAITFTNKAAAEMLTRISKLVPDDAGDMWIKTFHSACLRILRYDIEKMGTKYTSAFNVYDTNDQKRLVKDCIKASNVSEDMYPVKMLLSRISDCKNKGITPDEFENSVYDFKQKTIAKIYRLYQKRLE